MQILQEYLEELTQDDEILTAEELILKGFKDFKMTGDLDHSMESQYV